MLKTDVLLYIFCETDRFSGLFYELRELKRRIYLKKKKFYNIINAFIV